MNILLLLFAVQTKIDYISINETSDIPKYRQIIQAVYSAIRAEKLKRGDILPSLNHIKDEFGLSRDTVLAAFKEMKDNKIIVSTPGKGYYVASTNVQQEEKVFLLFDELNSFKEDIYNAFINEVGKKAKVEIYFHHFNAQVLKQLIEENKNNFTSFVIMPGNIQNIGTALKQLPFERTYILDRRINLSLRYGTVYQNFEKDIYEAMENGYELLKKYKKFILVSPTGKEPKERVDGFINFCRTHELDYRVIEDLSRRTTKHGEVYFVIDDRHLVNVIKQAQRYQLELGNTLGVVSFNNTMLKEVVANGITTISTDFALMGKRMAQMVMSQSKDTIENPAQLIIRNSL